MHRSLRLALVLSAGVSVAVTARQAQLRTVYISVVDKHGHPIPELSASEVTVTEDNQPRRIVTLERATAPIKAAVVMGERGLWDAPVRASLRAFALSMPSNTSIGLFSSTRAEGTLVGFTEPRQLLEAVGALAPINNSAADGTADVLRSFARQFQKDHIERPIIFVFAVGGPSQDSGNWDFIMRDIQRSRATVFAVGVPIGTILDQAAEVSGGHAEAVLATAGIPAATRRAADEILGQFALTYSTTLTPKDGFRVRVRVAKPDVTVRAPARVY